MPLDFSNIVDILSNGNRRRQQGQGQGQGSQWFRTPGFNPNADAEPKQGGSILAPATGDPGPFIGKRNRPSAWAETEMQAPVSLPQSGGRSPKVETEEAPAIPGGQIPVPMNQPPKFTIEPPNRTARPLPAPAPEGMPGAVDLPRNPMGKQTNQQEIDEADSVWKQGYKAPKGFGGRLKAAFMPLLEGAAKGFATTGDLGGAIGGAGAGFAGGLIAPRRVYEQQFEQKIKPKILERQGREDAEQKATAERAYKDAQTRNIESEIRSRDALAEQGKSMAVNAPAIYNSRTGKWEENPYYHPKQEKSQRFILGRDLVDENGKLIYRGEEKDTADYSISDGYLYSKKAGTYEKLPDKGMAQDKRNSIQNKFNQLHTAASKASQQLALAEQNLRTYKDEKAQDDLNKAKINYNAALKSLNDFSTSVGRDYPNDFEGAIGDNDWGYIKPRDPAPLTPRAQSSGGAKPVVDDRFVKFTAQRLGISDEEARRRIESGGYQYQPQQ